MHSNANRWFPLQGRMPSCVRPSLADADALHGRLAAVLVAAQLVPDLLAVDDGLLRVPVLGRPTSRAPEVYDCSEVQLSRLALRRSVCSKAGRTVRGWNPNRTRAIPTASSPARPAIRPRPTHLRRSRVRSTRRESHGRACRATTGDWSNYYTLLQPNKS